MGNDHGKGPLTSLIKPGSGTPLAELWCGSKSVAESRESLGRTLLCSQF